MTTRRNFIKGVGVAMAATPFAALTLGSKNAIATPKVCLRCSDWETPCFCHTHRLTGRVSNQLPPCPWYETDDTRFHVGDTYYNSLDLQIYTYTAGKDGYSNFWHPKYGLMCHACSQKAQKAIFAATNSQVAVNQLAVCGYVRMLSIACNTWPPYTNKWEGKCCCGHPWLKTATEDYARWQKGESDQEREHRRNYPTIHLWERYKDKGVLDSPLAVMGVDQIIGNLRYDYRTPNGSGYGIVNWDELAYMMHRHQIQMCVLNPDPHTHEAKKFQLLFPEHVVFCQYHHWVKGDQVPLVPSIDGRHAWANRSYWYRGDHPAAFCEIARELECARRYESGKYKCLS